MLIKKYKEFLFVLVSVAVLVWLTQGPRQTTDQVSPTPSGQRPVAPKMPKSNEPNDQLPAPPVRDPSLGDLLLHLPLNGSAEDLGAYHFRTIPTGVLAAEDRHGNPEGACSFPRGSYISIINSEVLDGLEAFTLSAWVRPKTLRKHRNIISKVVPTRDFNLQLNQTGKVSSHIHAGKYEFAYSDSELAVGEWAFVTATYRDKEWKIYINGQRDGGRKVDLAPKWTSSKLTVGNLHPGAPEAFLGELDDVRIHGRELSESEIRHLMQDGT